MTVRDRVRSARAIWAGAFGVVAVGVISAALLPARSVSFRTTPALILIVPIVVAGLIGGRLSAVVTAVAAALAFNVVFIPPYWTLGIHEIDDVVALAVFGFVAIVVGTLVARVAERRSAAERRAVELQVLNKELEAIQEERARLTEEATQAAVLKEVDAQRTALLRSVSHDLRTPLAGIRAVASDLLSGPTYDDATRDELLTLVVDETERLDRLVANLLSLSRIEAGALQPQRTPVAIDEVVNQAAGRLARILDGRRLQVELPPDLPLVRADFVQLEQVVTNLLENAIRHAPPRSYIRVGGATRGGVVETWIEDEGEGVLPFERERIFEPFRTGSGSASSGIGLAICRAVVEAHGGAIHVENAESGGARFAFTIPAS